MVVVDSKKIQNLLFLKATTTQAKTSEKSWSSTKTQWIWLTPTLVTLSTSMKTRWVVTLAVWRWVPPSQKETKKILAMMATTQLLSRGTHLKTNLVVRSQIFLPIRRRLGSARCKTGSASSKNVFRNKKDKSLFNKNNLNKILQFKLFKIKESRLNKKSTSH